MQDIYMGTILPFAFNFAPIDFQMCQGQLYSIPQYNALYSLLGTYYGGNGVQTFGLPDLRGRTLIGMGQGPGLQPYTIGQSAGTENVTLLTSQMPIHTHQATFTPTGGGTGTPITATLNVVNASGSAITAGATGTSYLAGSHGAGANAGIYATTGTTTALNPASITVTGGGGGSTGGTVVNAVAGGSQPFSILQPYLAINYCIAISGLYPSRN